MAKITFEGTVIEGTPQELLQFIQLGNKACNCTEGTCKKELAVGDYVRLKNVESGALAGFNDGEIARIIYVDEGTSLPYQVTDGNGARGWARVSNVEKY